MKTLYELTSDIVEHNSDQCENLNLSDEQICNHIIETIKIHNITLKYL